jgi:hypothetical protein
MVYFDIAIIITIQLFMCLVNSYKAIYRSTTALAVLPHRAEGVVLIEEQLLNTEKCL